MRFRGELMAVVLWVLPALAGTNSAIVVSAPRLDDLDLMAVDVASDVTVIDRATIDQSAAVSVPELLRTEANVLVRSFSGSPNDGQISLRGFGDNSHLRTLVLVDGHKINRPDMGAVGWQHMPVTNIERVEVIRGGQNVLYGDRALAGVVKITTKRGADAGTQAGGTIGSFGYISGFAGHGGGTGNLDYHIGVNGFSMDGYRTNSASKGGAVNGSLVWYPGDWDTISLRGSYSESDIQFPGPLIASNGVFNSEPTSSGNSGDDRSDVRSGLVTLIWETDRDWGAARISSGLNVRKMDWYLGGVRGLNRQYGVSLGPRVRFGDRDDFVMTGLDARYDALNFDNLLPADTRYKYSWAELDQTKLSPYAFAQKKFGRGYLINGGARYEYSRSDHLNVDYVDTQVPPTITGARGGAGPNPFFKPNPDVDPDRSYDGTITKQGWAAELALGRDFNQRLYGWIGYDRFYRYPVFDEVASYQGITLSDPLNNDLEPETGNGFDLGVRFNNRSWTASCTVFAMWMDNEIVFVSDPGANIYMNMNLGETQRSGADLELELDRSWYGAGVRWTLQDARLAEGENEGNRIPLVPWNHGVISAWLKPIKELRLALDYLFVSEQVQGNDDENQLAEIPAYGLLGFTANAAVTDDVRLDARIDNLFNEPYVTASYSDAYYPGTGRSFRVGLTLEF